MKRKQLYRFICIIALFILSLLVFSQDKAVKKNDQGFDEKFWVPIIIGLAGFAFGLYQYSIRKKNAKLIKFAELEAEKEFKDRELSKEDRTAEEIYCAALKRELGTLHLPGSPDIECTAVKLEDAFVSLGISETRRNDFQLPDRKEMTGHKFERHLSPEQTMKRAFQNHHLLLVIGDPGSGKTTLLKYYAINCLDKTGRKYRDLGFENEILPIYFPLRELEFTGEPGENGPPVSLPENLEKWCKRHHLDIEREQFRYWLKHRLTLVLLDGLDEIGNKEKRRKACQWIDSNRGQATAQRRKQSIGLHLPAAFGRGMGMGGRR